MKTLILETSFLNDPTEYDRYFSQMSPYRQQKINAFRFRKDRNLSLGAGILTDRGLREYGLRERDMRYQLGENEKPYFPDFPQIHFNLSHSEHTVMAVFSDTEVGCDLERIGTYHPEIASRFFSPSEVQYLAEQQDQTLAFFRLWTLKESFLKATGRGLSLPLDAFSITIDNGRIGVQCDSIDGSYEFEEYTKIDGYCASCCIKKEVSSFFA